MKIHQWNYGQEQLTSVSFTLLLIAPCMWPVSLDAGLSHTSLACTQLISCAV